MQFVLVAVNARLELNGVVSDGCKVNSFCCEHNSNEPHKCKVVCVVSWLKNIFSSSFADWWTTSAFATKMWTGSRQTWIYDEVSNAQVIKLFITHCHKSGPLMSADMLSRPTPKWTEPDGVPGRYWFVVFLPADCMTNNRATLPPHDWCLSFTTRPVGTLHHTYIGSIHTCRCEPVLHNVFFFQSDNGLQFVNVVVALEFCWICIQSSTQLAWMILLLFFYWRFCGTSIWFSFCSYLTLGLCRLCFTLISKPFNSDLCHVGSATEILWRPT